MNVADRPRFFGEAWRVLKPGGFFALTEHGLGPVGSPHDPVPWTEDGTGEFLVTPSENRELLAAARFVNIECEDTGPKYLAAYRAALVVAAVMAAAARPPRASADGAREDAQFGPQHQGRATHPVQLA